MTPALWPSLAVDRGIVDDLVVNGVIGVPKAGVVNGEEAELGWDDGGRGCGCRCARHLRGRLHCSNLRVTEWGADPGRGSVICLCRAIRLVRPAHFNLSCAVFPYGDNFVAKWDGSVGQNRKRGPSVVIAGG